MIWAALCHPYNPSSPSAVHMIRMLTLTSKETWSAKYSWSKSRTNLKALKMKIWRSWSESSWRSWPMTSRNSFKYLILWIEKFRKAKMTMMKIRQFWGMTFSKMLLRWSLPRVRFLMHLSRLRFIWRWNKWLKRNSPSFKRSFLSNCLKPKKKDAPSNANSATSRKYKSFQTTWNSSTKTSFFTTARNWFKIYRNKYQPRNRWYRRPWTLRKWTTSSEKSSHKLKKL